MNSTWAQIIGAKNKVAPPSRKGVQKGLRDFDDPKDSKAIKIGIELYRLYPRHVTAEELLNRVVTDSSFTQPRK